MFTGIVTDIGEVVAVEARAQGLVRLKIACGYDADTIDIGASIACSGVCLTVVAHGKEGARAWFAVEAAAETLRVTTVGRWRKGTCINLERPVKLGDELGGHVVAGHADGLAHVIAREDLTDMARFTFRSPAQLSRFIATKVSPATSLTVSDTPSSATDPFVAMKRESCVGERNVNRAMSVKSSRVITSARPSAWPATTCPPSSSPSLTGRSRLTRAPFCQRPTVVTRSVSAAASTANQARAPSLPCATTVRHTPLQAIEAPTSMVSAS